MTEENLATVLGPTILHNEAKVWVLLIILIVIMVMAQRKAQQGSYQVSKQDADELLSVCKVMEDLIRFQDSLFIVSL